MGSSSQHTNNRQNYQVGTENNVENHTKDHSTYNYNMSDLNVNYGDRVMGGVPNIGGIENGGTQIFRLVNLNQDKQFGGVQVPVYRLMI